jgi:hypothetical protein
VHLRYGDRSPPTTEATRFTEPLRTSPTAKTPRRPRLEHPRSGLPRQAGAHRTSVIRGNLPLEPRGVRQRPDEDEERRGLQRSLFAVQQVAYHDRGERGRTDQLAHLAVAPDLHPRCARHPVGETTGHVPLQVVVADDEVHRCCLPGQEDGCLAGGVASTDDRDRVARAKPRLVLGRCVVDAGRLEASVLLSGVPRPPGTRGPGGSRPRPRRRRRRRA